MILTDIGALLINGLDIYRFSARVVTMKVFLKLVSGNTKVGPVPCSITSAETCPPSCPFNGSGCYAQQPPLLWHWQKVTDGLKGMFWDEFCSAISKLPRGQFWRHNQAGDLPGTGEVIDGGLLSKLVGANKGRKGFTYTHKTKVSANFPFIKDANDRGFTVNLSADSLPHADELSELKIGPVAVVLPSTVDGNVTRSVQTPAGRKVVICPATYRENVTCASCQLCQKGERTCIVGFPAHGRQVKKVNAALQTA